MLFSLYPIIENSDFNLTQTTSLPILTYNYELGLVDTFISEFCGHILQICTNFRVIDETQTVVFDYNGFCQLVDNSDMILDKVSAKLTISKELAMEQAQFFFNTNKIIAQAERVLYSAGLYL